MPANISLDTAALWGFLLTLTRVGSALIFLPMPGFQNLAQPARIFLIVSSTFCLFPDWQTVAQADAGMGMVPAILLETGIGLIFGLTIALLFEAFQLGTQMISFQAGFSFASTFDPSSDADSNVLQVMIQLATGLLFFSLGIHGQILRMLSRSFGTLSLATATAQASSVTLILDLGTKMFMTALKLALPVVALLFLVDQALSALTRIQTSMQMMSLAFPAKIALALIFLTVILTRWVGVFEQLVVSMFGSVFKLLAA
jgi:flagellar biosynthetic protein FliR